MSATLQEIASAANVSAMTVSRVLRGVGRVAPQTRDRVRSIAAQLGYSGFSKVAFPSAVRRGKGGHRLRLLLPYFGAHDLSDHPLQSRFGQRFLEGLRARIAEIDGSVEPEPFDSLDEFMRAIERRPQYQGFVIRQLLPQHHLDEMRTIAPVVIAGSLDGQRGIDSVCTNEHRAASMVLNALTEQGHRQILWFGLIDRNTPHQGWLEQTGHATPADFLADSPHGARHGAWANLAYCQTADRRMPLLFLERDWKHQTLDAAMLDGARQILSLRPRPTAIVVSTVEMGSMLLPALASLGLRVPHDVSLVAYGNADAAGAVRPKLTVVDLPMQMIGRAVPELIQRRLADTDAPPISLQVEAGWFAGGSLAPAPRS